jgi:plastocyanin
MSRTSTGGTGRGWRWARVACAAAVAASVAAVAPPALARPAPGSKANPVKVHASGSPGFVPARLVVKPGAVVWFRSTDGASHTATAVRKVRGEPIFTSGAPSSGRFRIVAPRKPGTYAYACTVHTFMKGTLVVR